MLRASCPRSALSLNDNNLLLWGDAQMDGSSLNDALKHLMLKDLRIQCRARGITPAGSREALIERLKEHMLDTNDL